jgi:hypothetical protein
MFEIITIALFQVTALLGFTQPAQSEAATHYSNDHQLHWWRLGHDIVALLLRPPLLLPLSRGND